jgi:glyoxylase I family protein
MAGDRQWMGPSHSRRRSRRLGPLNFAVDDLDQHVADVSGMGLAPGAIETVNKGVQLSAIRDPEGNTITFIGDFRVRY